MSKYSQCYEIHKEMILEIMKQRVIRTIMRIVWVLDVKKVANELSGPFAKAGAPQADNDSSNPPEIFQFFLLKVLVEIHLIVIEKFIYNLSLFYQRSQDGIIYLYIYNSLPISTGWLISCRDHDTLKFPAKQVFLL